MSFSVFPSPFLDAFSVLVEQLAALLQPLFAGASTAAAVVLFTALVRLAVHPLSRAAVRGQEARVRLAPQVAALREKHKHRPERLQRAVLELHAEEKVSPLAGILPGLLQVPAFLLLYSLFSSGDRMAGHSLLAAPLDARWADTLGHGGPFGAAGLVYLALFALTAAVAAYQYRRTRRQLADGPQAPTPQALAKVLPLLSFGTVVTVAFVPLAVGLYLVTSTTWAVVERSLLTRKGPQAERGLAG
ncbi:membrane protein insertase YidC [Streptomyces sp. CC208A]|uniref:YidC/Oxa1 family membrane protein insertase n=1 Tax=Streptomyces sp. CC208A TaxID=3044573 RepID=UPI0024A8CA29|nr:membrane protein insertase YidC [Streptomyces sp. CC208A]